jgi:signal transduction histidine kinase
VEIQLRQQGDFFRVSVSDNGPGIAESDLPIVFDRFRQSTARREKPVGTGLGLPICRQIIDHFGGRIWAEGKQGKGARLCFKLPVKSERPPD